MELEYLSRATDGRPLHQDSYPHRWDRDGAWQLDCEALLKGVVEDVLAGREASEIGAKFHQTIVEASVAICEKAREEQGIHVIGLTGGVFQNVLLTQRLQHRLESRGFQVLCHRLVPPNDGGIALGQAVIARHRSQPSSSKSR